MEISIEVFTNRMYKTVGSGNGTYAMGAYTKIGSIDKDGNENYGVLDYYLIQGFKIELGGVDASYIHKMKNIKVSVESLAGNEVSVCGVNKITISRINGRYFTNVIPVICTKLKKKYLNCGIGNNDDTFNYQTIVFKMTYDMKNEEGVGITYHTQSSYLKFVTGRISNEELSNGQIQPIMNAMEMPSFYRPFYFNAVLLLFPDNFEINQSTHAYEFNEKVTGAELTSYKHSKDCHGRLFYSIANGTSMSEEMESKNDNGENDGNRIVNYLNKVVLDVNQGEYSLTINKPFRFYDELDSAYKGDGENNAAQNSYNKVESLTKEISFGITEPFSVDGNHVYRDGIPLMHYNNNVVDPILKRYNKNKMFFKNVEVEYDSTGEYFTKYKDLKYNNKQFYFPNDKKKKSMYFQSVGAWHNNTSEYNIDTTKALSVSFRVTDAAPNGHENEATTISLNYNGIKFYDEIRLNADGYTVEGYSSQGVKYYLLMINEEGNYQSPYGEFENIMRSIYDFSVCDTVNFMEPKIRYSGLHTNDYITETQPQVSSFNGWQSIFTTIKVIDSEVKLYGDNKHQCIDITGILRRCEGGQSVPHTCGEYRPIVIGIYDTYTSLDDDKYNDSKNNLKNRAKYVKLHTNRFSVIKVYRVRA